MMIMISTVLMTVRLKSEDDYSANYDDDDCDYDAGDDDAYDYDAQAGL